MDAESGCFVVPDSEGNRILQSERILWKNQNVGKYWRRN